MANLRSFYFSEKNEFYIKKVMEFINEQLDEDTVYRKSEAYREIQKRGVNISFSAFDRILKLITHLQSRKNKMLIELDNKITGRQQ